MEVVRNHTEDQRLRSLSVLGAETHLSSRLSFLPRNQTAIVFRILTPKLLRNGARPHRLCSRPQTFRSVPPLASLCPGGCLAPPPPEPDQGCPLPRLGQVGARFSPEPQFLAQCVLWVLSTLGCPGQWVAECSVEIQEIQRRQREEGC